jgi:tetratricopeptide (TPR) repeat protein
MRSLNSLRLTALCDCAGHHCEEAIAAWEETVCLDPHDADTHYQLGVCLGGGCGAHPASDAALALIHFRRALTLDGARLYPLLRARILGGLGNAYCHSSQVPDREFLRAAIWCYAMAAGVYLRLGKLDDWGRELYNLGNTWCDLAENEFPDKWHRAIDAYERSLRVRTRQADPDAHAATLQNLGTAYRGLANCEGASYVSKAIHCYRHALRIRRAADFPRQHAVLHNNLGNAYLTLPVEGPERKRRRGLLALRHFDRALTVATQDRFPKEYAVTQFNRGSALVRLARGSTYARPCLEKALDCFRKAGKTFAMCGQVHLSRQAQGRGHWVRRRLKNVLKRRARGIIPPCYDGEELQWSSADEDRLARVN